MLMALVILGLFAGTASAAIPTTTISNINISDDTGTSDTDFLTKTASQTITGTLNASLVAGETLNGSVDTGSNWINITDKVSGTAISWDGAILSGTSSIWMKVVNASGDGTVATQAYELDTTAPTTTISAIDISTDTGSSDTDFLTNTASQTITGTLSTGLVAGEILNGSVDAGSTWTNITDKVSGIAISWDGATLSGTSSIKIKVVDAAGNDGTIATQAYVLDTTAPTLSSWVLDMNAQTATLTFSETVNASSLNVTAITIQDAAIATTSYVLTDSSTASSDGTAIVIDLSSTDFNALTANTGLAVSQATSYVTIAATTIDDMAGNDVTAITDGSGVQATTFTAVPAAPSTDDDGGRPNLPAPLPNVITTEGKGLILSEPAASVTLDFDKGEVMSIVVDAKDVMDSIYITVQKLEGKPADVAVSAPGNVHSYININVGKVSGEIAGANIAFKVEKKWLSQNNIAKDNVMLARFSEGAWQQLETTVLNGDDDFVHFSARTPGFSTFAIVAKDVAVTEPVDEVEAPVSVEEPASEVVEDVPAPVEEEDTRLSGFEAIFAVMGLLLVTLLVRRQEKN